MKSDSIWSHILTFLEKEVPREDMDKWIKPLSLSDMDLSDGKITILAPNKFIKTWAEDHYGEKIKKVLKESLSLDVDISFRLAQSVKKTPETQKESETHHQPTKERDMYITPLIKEYVFDNFVMGSSNRFAYSACLGASKGFNQMNNPIYVYGDAGLGKTHLMHAVGNAMRINFPKLKILCTTGDLYLNEFVAAMRLNKTSDFKEKYASFDVLLFDDVQVITNGQKTMDEFFFLFSLMHSNNKQIIITSNDVPSAIPNLDKRLSSRFSGGLMVEVRHPSLEETIAIISLHAKILGAEISNEAAMFIAKNVKSSSTRELIGFIKTLVARSAMEKEDITVEFIQQVCDKYLISRDKSLSPEQIIEIVASFYYLKPADMKTKKRAQNIRIPRYIAMYMLSKKTHLSLVNIGDMFNRDHTTVINAIKRVEEMAKTDDIIKNTLEDMERKMKMDL